MRRPTFLHRLRSDEAGAYVVEFAVVAPVFLVLTMGAMDLGHTLYIKAVLQGAVQKASRDTALEGGSIESRRVAIDEAMTKAVKAIHTGATVDVTRRTFKDFTTAKQARMETFTDTNGNGSCDNKEPYVDSNESGAYDLDTGREGQGSAKDVTVYTATMTYPRMFPVMGLMGFGRTVTLTAKTVLANQPYADQVPPTVRECPL